MEDWIQKTIWEPVKKAIGGGVGGLVAIALMVVFFKCILPTLKERKRRVNQPKVVLTDISTLEMGQGGSHDPPRTGVKVIKTPSKPMRNQIVRTNKMGKVGLSLFDKEGQDESEESGML